MLRQMNASEAAAAEPGREFVIAWPMALLFPSARSKFGFFSH